MSNELETRIAERINPLVTPRRMLGGCNSSVRMANVAVCGC